MGPSLLIIKACKAGRESHRPWRAELGDDVTRQGLSPNGCLFFPEGLVFSLGLGRPDAASLFNQERGNDQLVFVAAQSSWHHTASAAVQT